MKKRITLPGEVVDFLFGILNTTAATSISESRKMRTIFQAMEKQLRAYHDACEAVRRKYRTKQTVKDGAGNDVDQWVFKDDVRDEVEKAMLEEANKTYDIDLDVESFSKAKVIFEGVFDRPELQDKETGKNNGIKGETQMKFISLCDDAFAAAKDV